MQTLWLSCIQNRARSGEVPQDLEKTQESVYNSIGCSGEVEDTILVRTWGDQIEKYGVQLKSSSSEKTYVPVN